MLSIYHRFYRMRTAIIVAIIVIAIIAPGKLAQQRIKQWRQQQNQKQLQQDYSNSVRKSACPRGGTKGFVFQEESNASYVNGIPPIVYVKTTKTGSSTIASILHRMADIRDLKVMIPKDLVFLGWPEPFPGVDNDFYKPNSIDMIMNHAVFNKERIQPYIRADNAAATTATAAFYFTSIREPYALQVSAYNFFSNATIEANITWTQHIDYLRQVKYVKHAPEVFFRNPLALDLGWYEHYAGAVEHDYDDAAIEEFVNHVDRNLHLVLLLEELNRGLILLGHYLGVEVNELVALQMKLRNDGEEKPYIRPLDEEHTKKDIYSINAVDVKLYEHFSQRFQEQWERESQYVAMQHAANSSIELLEDRLTRLEAMNHDIQALCGTAEMFIDNDCHQAFAEESMLYGLFLAKYKFYRGTQRCLPPPDWRFRK